MTLVRHFVVGLMLGASIWTALLYVAVAVSA